MKYFFAAYILIGAVIVLAPFILRPSSANNMVEFGESKGVHGWSLMWTLFVVSCIAILTWPDIFIRAKKQK